MKSWEPQTPNEVEELFLNDVREKKKESASRMVALKHKRVGKNMMFPYDFMSRAERLKHTKAGKVMTTNLYDNILTMDEFKQLEREEQRNRMIHWRNKYSNKVIQKTMKANNTLYYKIVDELELPKAPRVNTGTRKATVKVQTKAEPKQSLLEMAEQLSTQLKTPPAPPVSVEAPPVQEILVDGLHLVFRGTYTPEQIQKQLSKVELLLDGEDDSYYIEMKLMQKKQPIK